MKLLLFLLAPVLFAAQPTLQEARKFLDEAEPRIDKLNIEASRAGWVQENFITDDTEALAALANERAIAEAVRLAKAATRFDKLKLPPDMARKMMLLKNGSDTGRSVGSPGKCRGHAPGGVARWSLRERQVLPGYAGQG